MPGNPRKRKADEALLQEETNVQIPETPGPGPSISPSEEKIEILVEESGEVIMKNRRRACKNFNMNTEKMGIVKEPMNIQVMEDNDGESHFDELIDPALVLISDSARETGLNLLNNAKNSMTKNFQSIKWLFHAIKDLKGKRS